MKTKRFLKVAKWAPVAAVLALGMTRGSDVRAIDYTEAQIGASSIITFTGNVTGALLLSIDAIANASGVTTSALGGNCAADTVLATDTVALGLVNPTTCTCNATHNCYINTDTFTYHFAALRATLSGQDTDQTLEIYRTSVGGPTDWPDTDMRAAVNITNDWSTNQGTELDVAATPVVLANANLGSGEFVDHEIAVRVTTSTPVGLKSTDVMYNVP